MVIYETVNMVNGKRYIGKDKYNDPNYIGSGRLLQKAIKKYGKENFIKTILEYCESEEQLNDREKHWIKITNAQKSDVYYNIGEGGEGGDNITNNPKRDLFIKKMTNINNDPKYIRTKKGHSEKTKENQRLAAQGRYTLEWFIKRNGLELGTKLYNERNKRLSSRDLRGKSNPAYVHVDLDKLDHLIRNTNLGYNAMIKELGVGTTSFANRLKLLYGDNSVERIRKRLINN